MNRTLHALAPLTLALALAACGGGAPDSTSASHAAATAPTAAAAPQPAPQAATAEPADAGARTRQGLYLTAEQAGALIRKLDDRAVTVEARCCGLETAEMDVLMAFGVQAAANLPGDAPFIVSGRDLRQAAAVANRLAELGARQAYLVTR